MRRLVHLSDLHFGRIHEPLLGPLKKFILRWRCDLLIVSGDLTQRSRKYQFAAARAFLDEIPVPKFIVPGNHDIPLYKLWARFLNPFKNFKHFMGSELEPIHVDSEVALVGLNTVSLWRSGAYFSKQRLIKIKERFDALPQNLLKILVTHHSVPQHRLEKHGLHFDLLLSGHNHQSTFIETVRHINHRQLRIEAGTSTSTRLRGGFVNSFNLLEIGNERVNVQRWDWGEQELSFKMIQEHEFVRNLRTTCS